MSWLNQFSLFYHGIKDSESACLFYWLDIISNDMYLTDIDYGQLSDIYKFYLKRCLLFLFSCILTSSKDVHLQTVSSQKSGKWKWDWINDHMCDVCNLVKQCFHVDDGHSLPEDTKLRLSRHLRSAHTLLEESSSHRNLCPFPLSDPASLTLPATPCPQQLPHISHQNQPPIQASNSCTLFPETGYSVTEKSPSGRIEFQILLGHAFLYRFTSFFPRTFITSCKAVSTQRWHGIIQSLTDPLARMSQFQMLLLCFSQKRTVKPLFSLCSQQVSVMSQGSYARHWSICSTNISNVLLSLRWFIGHILPTRKQELWT